MQMSSQDSSHLNDRKSEEMYLDLDASSRQPQSVYQVIKDSGGNSEVRNHSGDITSSPSRDYEYQDISETRDPAIDVKLYLHLDISSRQPKSTYQGITHPADLMNSEMYAELDPKYRSKETEYQDVTGIGLSDGSDQNCEYQVVLNDNSSRQVPIPPPVEHDKGVTTLLVPMLM